MLVKNITAEHVFLACGHTDMRKSIDGLAAIVQQNFKLNLFSQDIFMFCGRRKDRIKALFWDGDGFSLLSIAAVWLMQDENLLKSCLNILSILRRPYLVG